MESLVKQSPLPKLQLSLLCFLRTLDPLNFTQIFPYVNEFIRNLDPSHDTSTVGFYSGILESSFAVCQLLTVYPWGFLADSIGRRAVILVGIAGLAFSTILLGFSRSFSSALASRALAGLFSGNVAVLPSVLCDITDSHNQSLAFAFFGLWWPLGAIIGPLIGGTLSNPAARYVWLFDHQFFRSYPYFLPSFVVASITLIALIMSYCFLNETLETTSRMTFGVGVRWYTGTHSTPQPILEKHTILELLTIPVIRTLCVSSCALSFVSTAFDVLFVLFCYYPIHSGGLGFSSSEIGYALALSGAIAAALQFFVMPTLLMQFDHAKIYHFCMQIWPCVFMGLPLLHVVARHSVEDKAWELIPVFVWVGIAVILLAARVAYLGYSLNMVLVKRYSAPSALGSTYALVQFFICLSRSFSPAFSSLVFTSLTELDHPAGYAWAVVMTVICIGSCHVSKQLVIECREC